MRFLSAALCGFGSIITCSRALQRSKRWARALLAAAVGRPFMTRADKTGPSCQTGQLGQDRTLDQLQYVAGRVRQ